MGLPEDTVASRPVEEDVQLASKVGKVVGVRHSALLIMLDNGLTTRELLSAKLQSLTPPPDH